MDNKVLTGAIALIKVQGEVVGKMRNVRAQESVRRLRVGGIGTILPSEQAATEWDGTLSCDFMLVNIQKSGIKNAIRRDFSNVASQILSGEASFEDQLVLDVDGVQVDLFKKITDVILPDGTINPKAIPIAIVRNCLIESDSFDISEGAIAGRSQSFKYLLPLVEIKNP